MKIINKIFHPDKGIPFFPWGFHIVSKWMKIKNAGRTLIPYFEDNCICNVAIYGLGAIGNLLWEELREKKINVSYGIDRNARNIKINGLQVKTLNDHLPEVDMVIVTPVDFNAIEKEIYQRVGEQVDIVSIEDVVNYCFRML